MRSVSALEVRKKFGELLDEAAAGERLIIERAGQPIAALVPLSDVPELNREARIKKRLAALDEMSRLAKLRPTHLAPGEAAAIVRQQRDERAKRTWRVIDEWRERS